MVSTTTPRDRTHDCPGGCGQQVRYAHFACKSCWFRLPEPLRQAIRDSFKRRTTRRSVALYDAMEWFRAHPPTVGPSDS